MFEMFVIALILFLIYIFIFGDKEVTDLNCYDADFTQTIFSRKRNSSKQN